MKLEIKESELRVLGGICSICGETTNNITQHHTLPKHLKPKFNVVVPVCKKCHDNINKLDKKSVVAFGYKIMKDMKEVKRKLKSWLERTE